MTRPRQPRDARSSTAQAMPDVAGLAAKAATNLSAAPGFAEGAFEAVRVSNALMMFDREPQVGGQTIAIVVRIFIAAG